MKVQSFDRCGNLINKGYAQLHLPVSTGNIIKTAYIYSVVKNVKWYHRAFKVIPFLKPFLEPPIADYDDKDIEEIIAKGNYRELEKIVCIGKITINTETLLRNYEKFGYR